MNYRAPTCGLGNKTRVRVRVGLVIMDSLNDNTLLILWKVSECFMSMWVPTSMEVQMCVFTVQG